MSIKKLNIAVTIFVYNRSKHTKKVLESLKKNDIIPSKLFVFQDGKKKETNIEEWNKVNKIINDIDWCSTEIVVSQINQGLSVSIVKGLNYIFQRFDAVIVLEDDCVVHPKFMSYMINSLKKYNLYRQVYSINGYTWPTNIHANGTDAYFVGRASSWGWATWKDRWNEYKEDYKVLTRIKKDVYAERQFYIWGRDLENYLYGNIEGRCDSWAVFWALLVLERHGYCLTPYKSLVENIGFDGTGVHCGIAKVDTNFREIDNAEDFLLPDIIEFPDNYEDAYKDIFSWISTKDKLACYNKMLEQWVRLTIDNKKILDYFIRNNIGKIAIWGKGILCELLLKSLKGKVDIIAIIESVPTIQKYLDIPIVSLNLLPKEVELIIVVPIFDMEKIRRKVEDESKFEIIGLDELLKMV